MMKSQATFFKSRKLFNERGFTLIELLVVTGIITVVGSISLMVIMQQMPTMRLKNGLTTIRSQVNNAKAMALRHGKPIIVEIDPPNRIISFYSDENENCVAGDTANVTTYNSDGSTSTNPVSDVFLKTYVLPSGIEFGFGPPYADPPPAAPDYTTLDTGDYIGYDTGNNDHEVDGKYVLVFSSNGRFIDKDKKLSHVIIYLCNPHGRYAALEILAGGTAIAHFYNTQGDQSWRNS